MLPVVWLPEADADLMEARAWYDRINWDLGERFASAPSFRIAAFQAAVFSALSVALSSVPSVLNLLRFVFSGNLM